MLDTLNTKSTAKMSYVKELRTDCLIAHPSSVTYESSTESMQKNIRAWLTSLQGDFHVSHFQLPESKKEKTTQEICGPKLSVPFAWYDPDTSTVRTSQASLLQDTCPEYSQTWPKQGMMQDGKFWVLTMLGPDTKGNGCGYWPTPRNRMTGNVSPNRVTDKFNNLESVISREMWPTPKSQNANSPGIHGQGGMDLQTTVAKWPTPRGQDSYERRNMKTMKRIYDEGGDLTLVTKIKVESSKTGQLNPDWVEWLMGWPLKWSALEPITELVWCDWSADPADVDSDEMWRTPSQNEPGINPKRLRPIDGGELGGMNRYFNKETGRMAQIGITQQVQLRRSGKGIIPRITTEKKDRVNRLKAIGNGQVPQCAATAWEILNI